MYIKGIAHSKCYTLLLFRELFMKIIAISDLHGNLPSIRDKGDILIIAGDWSPLYIQHDYNSMIEWINKKFIPWMISINTKYKIFIPGNHDLVCTYKRFNKDLNEILERSNLQSSIYYLNNSSITINNKKFYGIPDTEHTSSRWAFAHSMSADYSFDEDTDILITHQPPRVNNIGYVKRYNTEFGSLNLRDRLVNSSVKLNICGHIHEGDHVKHTLITKFSHIDVYNVSLLDEEYDLLYKPTIIEMD